MCDAAIMLSRLSSTRPRGCGPPVAERLDVLVQPVAVGVAERVAADRVELMIHLREQRVVSHVIRHVAGVDGEPRPAQDLRGGPGQARPGTTIGVVSSMVTKLLALTYRAVRTTRSRTSCLARSVRRECRRTASARTAPSRAHPRPVRRELLEVILRVERLVAAVEEGMPEGRFVPLRSRY